MQPSDDDQDQPAMQEAIAVSLRDGDSNYIKTDELDPPVHTCQNRVNIDDRIKDMTMQAAIELPILHDAKGDTWIFIDAPQRQPEQEKHDYERYIKRYKDPILMQKDTLTRYSPGLAELFGPSQQFRFLRRRKLANKLPSNVKYVIDLTPASEGEDLVFQMTELSCSEGVRLWYQSGQIWKVSKTLVKGEEEYTSMSQRATSNKSMLLEYSPVRHRSAIERVLSALQGMDPLLDSATKVWTTFAVAKNFTITHSPLEDYIIRWIRAYPNSYFLEVLPEVSHRIAEGLQNYDLARDSFAILVGEEALDSLRHAREPRLHKRTTFGRKKEELPEHIRTRVEYASKSFLERISNDFAYLVADGLQWIDELPEVRRLSGYTQPKIQETVNKLKDLLKIYVRGRIYKTLCVDYSSVPGPDLHHEGGQDLLPRLDRAVVWTNMPLNERILSRTFYRALKSILLLNEAANLDLYNGWRVKGGLDELSHTERSELAQGTYREVKNSELRALIHDGQTLLDQAQQIPDAHSLPRPLHTLPSRIMGGAQEQKKPWDSFSTLFSDRILYDAQRESNIKPWPKQSYALPDRTVNGAQDFANNSSKATFSAPSQPIDFPKAPKRTQDFRDALSSPNYQQSAIDVRTKWPFGAARDDPAAQVLKRLEGLHESSEKPDRRPATDSAVEDSAGQGRENEGIARGIDPWRGYSGHLNYASETLRRLAPKTTPTATNTAPEKTAAPTKSKFWEDFDKSDDGVEVWQPIQDSRPKESFFTATFFDLGRFFDQAQDWIEGFASIKLRSSDHDCMREPLELGIVNTLVCLEDKEWKYLPLWAGGNDDESNGVYSDDVPTAEHGFVTPGPEIHDGLTPANSVKASSEFELVSAGDSASTFNASTATNRGFSDTIHRNQVHAVDSTDGSMSDDFTMVTPSVDSVDVETFARKQVEAQERIDEAEQEAAAIHEASRIVKGKGKMVEEDESYADLFSGEEEEEEDGNATDRAEFNDENDDDEDIVFI